MNFEISMLDGGIKQVNLVGRLDMQGTAAIEDAFMIQTATKKQAVLVDMSGVEFIASIGMRMLLSNAKALVRREGKGMPAALFMVRVITLLRMSLKKTKKFKSLLSKVNAILCQNNDDCMFVTLFVGLLDVTTGQLTYVNGGHNPPLFSANGGPFELLTVPKGILLGVSENAQYEMAELTLHTGDTLILYTDGVTEAENIRQDIFSVERACQVLEAVANDEDITAIVKTLNDAVTQFSTGVPQSDDITMLALRYWG